MLRQFLFLGVGGLALTVVLGAPGQLHAQRFRASLPPAIQPGFRGVVTPRFPIGVNPSFNRGFFDPRFNTGFSPGFNMGFSPLFFRPF